MLVALLALLPKRSDDISERAEALIDILRLPQTILVLPSTARVEPLTAGEVDEVQRALAHLAGVRVGAADAQREDGVRARGALIHQRRRNRASRVCRREQRADLCRRAERLDYDVRDARRTPFLVLDLVLLLVEFAFSEEVIDGFVVLWFGLEVLYLCTQNGSRTISRNWPSRVYSQPLLFSSSITWKTWSTARGIMPTVPFVFHDGILGHLDGSSIRAHLPTLLPS